MSGLRCGVLCTVIALLLAPAAWPDEAPPRVFLIGIDGGSWNVIDPMMQAADLLSETFFDEGEEDDKIYQEFSHD